MITISRLEGFHWVARTGGFARAARAFPYPITQPAVHQQVRKLEHELGVTLFERIGKDRMQLTAAGQRLHAFTAPLFDGLETLVRSLRGGQFGGELKILAEGLMLRHLLPEWLKRLRKRSPGVIPHLRELESADVTPLRRGEADLLVGYLPDLPDDIASLEVARLWPFLVVPADHALARRRRLQLADLADEPFVAYSPGLRARELQFAALRQAGIIPQRELSASSADTILGFVAAGLGWSLVPALDADGPKLKNLAAFPLRDATQRFAVVCAWRKDTPENPLLDAALATAPRPA